MPAVPAKTATIAPLTNASLTVDQPIILTAPAGLAAAADNRAYGTGGTCSGGACVAASFTVAGGLGGYSANASVVSAPGTWTCPLTGTTYNCSTNTVVNAGPYPATSSVSIAASDTGNAATPAATVASDPASTGAASLTIAAPLTLAAPASAAAAVTGRSYGQAATGCNPGPACAAIPYTVSGGLGGYSANATVVAAPGTWTCPLTGTTYNCSSATVTGSGTSNLSLTASDAANASAPAGTSNTATFGLAVNGALTLTAPASPATAANGRPYGSNASVANPAACGVGGASACAPAAFVVSGGLGGYSTTATTSAAPGTWVCPLSGSTYACATTSVTAIGPFPATPNLSLNAVSDTANASTVSGNSNPATVALTVGGPVTLTAPVGLPTAVSQRGYGSNPAIIDSKCGPAGTAACAPAAFAVSGGLGAYAATANVVAAPGAWQCPLTGSNYTCATNLVSTAGPFPASPILSLVTSDTPNASSPSGLSNTATTTLSVNDKMAVTPAGIILDTVTGRPMGQTNNCLPGPTACQPIHYTASLGLGNYQTGTLAIGTGALDTLACPVAAATYSCSTAKIRSNPAPGLPLTMTANELGNASTPSGTATDTSQAINVDSEALVAANLGATWPNGVQHRPYANGATQLQFTASNGLPPYVFPAAVPGSFPSGFGCTPTATVLTCSSAGVGNFGAFSPQVTITDTGNASTPPATVATDPTSQSTSSLTVTVPLNITTATLPNGLVSYPYPTVAGASTLQVTGGTGPYSWAVAPSTACSVPLNGSLPAGVSIDSTTGAITGTPTAASTVDTDFNFDVCVSDPGNTTTPGQGFVANLTLNVIDTLAYVTEPGSDQAEVINTTSQALWSSSPIGLDGGGSPYAVALSPSGGVAYFTEPGTNQLAVIDTITGVSIPSASITLPTLPSACTPHGVAATKLLIFVACSGNGTIVVLDASTLSSTPVATISTSATTTTPEQIAIRADGQRVYVTLSATNQLFVIDNSVSPPVKLTGGTVTNPFTLQTGNGVEPFGIVVAPYTSSTGVADLYAYISKQAGTATADGVDVVSGLLTDAFNNVASIQTSSTGTAVPSFVAATPDNKRIYVSLNSTGTVAVIGNAGTPAQITGSPFTVASGSNPTGIAIPALSTVPSTGVRVYIAESGKTKAAIFDDATPPAADSGSPITLNSSTLNGMAAVQPPQ